MKHHLKHKMYRKNLAKLLTIIAIAGISILLIVLYFISFLKTSPPTREESWPVATMALEQGNYSPVVTLYGKVESFRATKLESTIDADVHKVFIKDGSNVTKGQILIELDDKDAKILEKQRQAEYNQIKAQVKELELKYESDKLTVKQQEERVKLQKKELSRLEILYKKQLSSESLRDQAISLLNEQLLRLTQNKLAVENYQNVLAQKQAELLRAEANLDDAKLDVERTIIKAPYDGKIVALNTAIGNRVQPGEVLIELFPTSDIELRAQIPTKELGSISKALQDNKTLYAYASLDGQQLQFELERISGNVATGQIGVDAMFKLVTNDIFIAKNRIIVLNLSLPKINNVYAIPETALFDQDIVYEVINNRLHAIKVSLHGLWYNQKNEAFQLISSPKLKDGSTILITHLLNAREGLKVNVNKTS